MHSRLARFQLVSVSACLAMLLCARLPSAASETGATQPTVEQIKYFEQHVRPMLAEHCYGCHGEEKQTSDLRLDSRAAMLAGGESGPAVVPGKPDESLLIEAINFDSFEMPPTGKLKDEQIAIITNWVRIGAPWPKDGNTPAVVEQREKITDEDRNYWFFQPLANPQPPKVDDGGWSRTPIDSFIYRRLHAAGLTPAPAAETRKLVRRVYFDLIGLPPSPEQIDRYLANEAPDRYEQLIDELLSSPRYGERWARHWLDLVRYAESDGWRQDAGRPHAYKYRDYVIRSFNEDKPYDRFVKEQIAGDEIAPGDPEALTATMYLRHGIYEYNQRDVRTQWDNILNEINDTTGDVFLGLGMGCARCHDHKFDPILKKDYYRLRAFFTPLLWRDDQPVASLAERAAHDEQRAKWGEEAAEIRRELDAIEWPVLLKAAGGQGFDKFPPDIKAMMLKLPADRTPYEHQLAELALRQLTFDREKLPGRIKGEQKQRWEELRAALAKFDTEKPQPLKTMAFAVSDAGPAAPPTVIPGDRSGEDVVPGFLTVLNPEPASITPPPRSLQSTGRRTALAEWLTDPENPLTTRVIVNRVWQQHFGRGLVSTASDFGRLGEPPSHPDLLDWLARRFVADGWSFKRLHRLIVKSSVYRQSALHSASDAARMNDPANRLLSRMNTKRLDAEQIRDSLLSVTGELDLKMGGASVSGTTPRRSVYTKVIRNTRDPLLDVFDVADGFASLPQRNVTTTPIQSLLMINGSFVLARAKAMARRLQSGKYENDAALVTEAYRHAFGREPTEREMQLSLQFLKGREIRSRPPASGREKDQLQLAKMSGTGGLAAVLKPGTFQQRLETAPSDKLPDGDFTVEAIVFLHSLYSDATVRTIAAHWDNNNNRPGWALGVTSAQSRYTPRNLILQLVGNTTEGKLAYEVIPSGLHPELNTPYYVAASVKIADTSSAGVTFYMKKLTPADSPLEVANVEHRVIGDYRADVAFTIGGRDRTTRHFWDGLIGEVRVSRKPLTREELLIETGGKATDTVGHWKFDRTPDPLADISGNGLALRSTSGSPPPADPRTSALIDFCHVLLNANEFVYVD